MSDHGSASSVGSGRVCSGDLSDPVNDSFGSSTGPVSGGGMGGQGSVDGGVRPGVLRTSTGRTASGGVFVTGLMLEAFHTPSAPRVPAPAVRRLATAIDKARQGPAIPRDADYQRRPIGGLSMCQDSGRYWARWHTQPPRGAARPWHGPLTETWEQAGSRPALVRLVAAVRRAGGALRHLPRAGGSCRPLPSIRDRARRALLRLQSRRSPACPPGRARRPHRRTMLVSVLLGPPAGRILRLVLAVREPLTTSHFLTVPPAWASKERSTRPCGRRCSMITGELLGRGVGPLRRVRLIACSGVSSPPAAVRSGMRPVA